MGAQPGGSLAAALGRVLLAAVTAVWEKSRVLIVPVAPSCHQEPCCSYESELMSPCICQHSAGSPGRVPAGAGPIAGGCLAVRCLEVKSVVMAHLNSCEVHAVLWLQGYHRAAVASEATGCVHRLPALKVFMGLDVLCRDCCMNLGHRQRCPRNLRTWSAD
ncbi:hypothetical protein Anapl_17771 [Anas platyrhynchos]|uniref:Secreted protein n=1 Tax=Anas platyrhynchos TaxID=8839 RepID=R0JAY8_ANAPL|nr:hypothetical protein Anapl_17771 [Anas platyrhynchos]